MTHDPSGRSRTLGDNGEGKFFTAQQAAIHLKNTRVGKTYKTCGDLYDVPDDLRTVGMLETIYELLLSFKTYSDADLLERHSRYMRRFFDEDTKRIKSIHTEIKRIIKLCHGVDTITRIHRVNQVLCYRRIPDLASAYVDYIDNSHVFYELREEVYELLLVLRGIRSVDHFARFHGFGKTKLRKLKEQIEQRKANQ